MNKEHSSYAALMTLPDPTLQPERILFLHVVAQAVIDATSKDRLIRGEIENWVDTEDFEVVCGMAGLQTTHISNLINSLLNDRNKKRAFKMAMEFRFMVRTFVESHTKPSDK